ncbi:MAG: tetratricopeptide repeat protein [Polyangiaceae bacterium]|nr:tetratricopeptide repeat protein [Polyangiaceae bacterium]
MPTDEPATARLSRRTGELFAQLGETNRALTFYRRALSFEPESTDLFAAIDALLIRAERPEDRVELYRGALDHRFEPQDRLKILHTVADLERTALGQPDKAIETYKAALDVDESDAVSLDALTELYRERERYTELAELILRRADNELDADTSCQYRLSLARLQRDQMNDFDAAIDQLEEIVRRVPSHRAAVADLEALMASDDHKSRVVGILLPLYEGADDWRKLIHLNAQRFDLAADDLDRVAILRETAKLWEERGGDSRRAFGALRAAFEVQPEQGELHAELERLAEALGAWDDLAEAYEGGIETADGSVKRELLAALASIHDDRRDDPRQALLAYSKLHELDETDPEPLEKMDCLSVLLADWNVLVSVLTKKADLVGTDEERADAWRRVGECKRDMLENPGGAIQAFERALELDPLSASTLNALIELHEERQDAQRLVELYQRRVELAEDDQEDLKYQLLVAAAERYKSQLGDQVAAIDMLRQALDVKPADRDVLRKLETLFRSESMWSDLLETLRLEASVAEDINERISLRRDIGKLLASEMAEPAEALEAFRMVLDEAPSDAEAVDAVRAIGEAFEELRLEAAEILEPVLRSSAQYEILVAVLEMRHRAQTDAAERAATLRAIAQVRDGLLSDPVGAQEALLRALAETPDDDALHDEIERLAAACDGFGRYADALEERAGKVFEASLARELWTRLGKVCEDRLSNDARAVEAFSRAMEQAGDAPDLLQSLDRLHSRLGNAQQLSEVLDRRVSVETDSIAQADLYHRLALLQIESFGDKVQGLETLRMALDCAPDHQKSCESLEKLTAEPDLFEDAATALETVYRTREDYARLADLYEKRVSHAPTAAERLRVRLDLARVLEEQARDPKRAQRVMADALVEDLTDAEVLAKLESLAETNQQWDEATKALSGALEKAQELDTMTARDLYTRLSDWFRTKLSDARQAEQAMLCALERDPDNLDLLRAVEDLQREPGRERDLIVTLRRRAVLEMDSDRRRDLFREAKTLAETIVHDEKMAEDVLRQLIDLDPGYLWALEELTTLREKADDFKEAVDLLVRRAEITASGPETARLRHQAAQVLRERLNEPARALEVYQEVFEADPMDAKAAQALRELYAAEGHDRDLADLLERLIDVSSDTAERNKLRLELAELWASKFNQIDDSVLVLHRVLEEEPGMPDAVVALSQLYEKSGRDQELADLLNTQIDLAKQKADSDAELTLTVRLGEIYESRLGDTGKAIETYQLVLDRDASHRGALESLGRLYEAKGEPQKAGETLEKLLGLLQDDEAVALALRLAEIFGKTGDSAGARRALERGFEVRRDATEIREQLRKLYEKTGAWAEVAALLAEDAEAASDDATKVKLLQQAADIHMAKRDDAAAAADLLQKASQLAPEDRDLLLALCDAFSASGRGKDAVAALERVVASYGGKRVKELATIHHRLAKAYVADGDKRKGLSELDQAFRITPGNLAILVDLGRLAIDLEDLDRAQKTFRALLLQRLDDSAPITKAEVFYYLAEVSHRQGEDQKAVQMLERALENDPSLAKAQQLLERLRA